MDILCIFHFWAWRRCAVSERDPALFWRRSALSVFCFFDSLFIATPCTVSLSLSLLFADHFNAFYVLSFFTVNLTKWIADGLQDDGTRSSSGGRRCDDERAGALSHRTLRSRPRPKRKRNEAGRALNECPDIAALCGPHTVDRRNELADRPLFEPADGGR